MDSRSVLNYCVQSGTITDTLPRLCHELQCAGRYRDSYSVLQYGVRYGDRYSVELLTYGVRYRVDCLAGSNVCCGKYVDRVTLTCGLESGIST